MTRTYTRTRARARAQLIIARNSFPFLAASGNREIEEGGFGAMINAGLSSQGSQRFPAIFQGRRRGYLWWPVMLHLVDKFIDNGTVHPSGALLDRSSNRA